MNPNTFSALLEPNRFYIVEILRNGPRSVNEITNRLSLNQPQVSKHLKVLADAGIVESTPLANQRFYSLRPDKFQELDQWLQQFRYLWEQRLNTLDELLRKEVKKDGAK
ncbi:MAG: helix-turn-helix transcriptional regulator [Patescibacteria group bacterium]|nr:helix-turn-helix transcriptional regulator [Patescibacteria group bacterium]MDE2590014.1 helix-turn-helix transcriptional regulator [Patescibacteria group bacterium]